MHPAQLRKLLKTKKKKKTEISSDIRNKMLSWYSTSKDTIFNKKNLSMEYRRILKRKVLEYLRTNNVGCSNIDKLLYFIDKHNITQKGLELLGCGSNGCALKTCIDTSCNNQIVVKLGSVEGNYNYSLETHPNRVEVSLYRIMNKFLLDNRSPHYTFFYGSFNCGITILDLITDRSKRKSMKKKSRESKYELDYDNKVQVMIVEKANTDLYNFLKKVPVSMDMWINIIFQVCYMLVVTQYYCPGFRHNDFKSDNILVDEYEPKPNSFIKYIIFGKEFFIPDIGIRLKLWDLDFASTDSRKNAKVEDSWSDSFGCSSKYNSIYDMHTLLNILLHNHKYSLSQDIKEWIMYYLTTNDENIISLLIENKIISEDEDEYVIMGYDTQLTSYGRLTGNLIGVDNLVPDDFLSPGDMLLTDDTEDNDFIDFLSPKPADAISNIFDSKIPKPTLEYAHTRRDIFNSILN